MRVFRFMATSPLIKDSVHRPVKLTALSGHFSFALPRTSELSFDKHRMRKNLRFYGHPLSFVLLNNDAEKLLFKAILSANALCGSQCRF
jgi:hypothetical protein